MKIADLIARILLGLIFVFFGSNGFLNFIPAPPLPAGPAGQFSLALFQTHYFVVVGILEFAGGLLLLFNRYVPLALVILGPIIVNILLFHVLMHYPGLLLAILVAILWGIIFLRHRQYFSGIFIQRAS